LPSVRSWSDAASGRLARFGIPIRRDDRDARRPPTARDECEELERRHVGRVDVVEHEEKGGGAADGFEELEALACGTGASGSLAPAGRTREAHQ
jgi:hypothetical protein